MHKWTPSQFIAERTSNHTCLRQHLKLQELNWVSVKRKNRTVLLTCPQPRSHRAWPAGDAEGYLTHAAWLANRDQKHSRLPSPPLLSQQGADRSDSWPGRDPCVPGTAEDRQAAFLSRFRRLKLKQPHLYQSISHFLAINHAVSFFINLLFLLVLR